jgi:exosortase H (IPTLxxWG-CTERM-specific)
VVDKLRKNSYEITYPMKIDPKKLFVIKFLVLVVAGYIIVALNQVNDRVVVPFTEGIATASASLLRLLGQPVISDSTLIRSDSFSVVINNGCNGLEAMIILSAAVLAFPASFLRRTGGLVAGFVLIQLVNLVRVVSLYLIGRYYSSAFDVFHSGVWQIAVIAVAITIFIVWSLKFARPASPQLSQ